MSKMMKTLKKITLTRMPPLIKINLIHPQSNCPNSKSRTPKKPESSTLKMKFSDSKKMLKESKDKSQTKKLSRKLKQKSKLFKKNKPNSKRKSKSKKATKHPKMNKSPPITKSKLSKMPTRPHYLPAHKILTKTITMTINKPIYPITPHLIAIST